MAAFRLNAAYTRYISHAVTTVSMMPGALGVMDLMSTHKRRVRSFSDNSSFILHNCFSVRIANAFRLLLVAEVVCEAEEDVEGFDGNEESGGGHGWIMFVLSDVFMSRSIVAGWRFLSPLTSSGEDGERSVRGKRGKSQDEIFLVGRRS